MDVRVVSGLAVAGFAVGAAVEITKLVRHRRDLRTVPDASPEVRAELVAHRESRRAFAAVRAVGCVLMVVLLAGLTFFVEPGKPDWSGG